MAAKVVSFINLKGGVGKTTLALAIAEWLAFGGGGQKVLLVDIDAQYNLSSALLPEPRLSELWDQGKSIHHMFKAALDGANWDTDQVIVKDCSNIHGNVNLHVLVSNPQLGQLDEDILDRWYRRTSPPPIDLRSVLGAHIRKIKDRYSWIIIDCPPSLSIFTSNAILCSDWWIAPLIPETLSLYGVDMITGRIRDLKERSPGGTEVKIEFAGSVLNRIDISRKDHQKLAANVYRYHEPGRYKPFDCWMGDWKPLYIVSDYRYPSEQFDDEWPNVRVKYGNKHSEAQNNADTAEKALLHAKLGLNSPYFIYQVVLNLTREFQSRCR